MKTEIKFNRAIIMGQIISLSHKHIRPVFYDLAQKTNEELVQMLDEVIDHIEEGEGLRVCSATKEKMEEGFIVNDGDYYFKHEVDLIEHLRNYYGNSVKHLVDKDLVSFSYKEEYHYWTEWEKFSKKEIDSYYLALKVYPEPVPNFPKGFDSWQETHFHISQLVEHHQLSNIIYHDEKMASIAEVVKHLTHKFEEKYANFDDWDNHDSGSYMEAIEEFLEERIFKQDDAIKTLLNEIFNQK